jgi:hypothetical protein
VFTDGREGLTAVVVVPLLDGLGAGVPAMTVMSGVVEEDSSEEVEFEFRASERVDVEKDAEVLAAGVICVTRLLGTEGIEVMRDVCAEVCCEYRAQRSSRTAEETIGTSIGICLTNGKLPDNHAQTGSARECLRPDAEEKHRRGAPLIHMLLLPL